MRNESMHPKRRGFLNVSLRTKKCLCMEYLRYGLSRPCTHVAAAGLFKAVEEGVVTKLSIAKEFRDYIVATEKSKKAGARLPGMPDPAKLTARAFISAFCKLVAKINPGDINVEVDPWMPPKLKKPNAPNGGRRKPKGAKPRKGTLKALRKKLRKRERGRKQEEAEALKAKMARNRVSVGPTGRTIRNGVSSQRADLFATTSSEWKYDGDDRSARAIARSNQRNTLSNPNYNPRKKNTRKANNPGPNMKDSQPRAPDEAPVWNPDESDDEDEDEDNEKEDDVVINKKRSYKQLCRGILGDSSSSDDEDDDMTLESRVSNTRNKRKTQGTTANPHHAPPTPPPRPTPRPNTPPSPPSSSTDDDLSQLLKDEREKEKIKRNAYVKELNRNVEEEHRWYIISIITIIPNYNITLTPNPNSSPYPNIDGKNLWVPMIPRRRTKRKKKNSAKDFVESKRILERVCIGGRQSKKQIIHRDVRNWSYRQRSILRDRRKFRADITYKINRNYYYESAIHIKIIKPYIIDFLSIIYNIKY